MRLRRLLGTTGAVVASMALVLGLGAAPAQAEAQLIRTCSAAMGVPWSWINFDVLVHVNGNTVLSAERSGDAYPTGVYAGTVTHTQPGTIDISTDRHGVHFVGSAVVAIGIPNSPLTISQNYGCEAFWAF